MVTKHLRKIIIHKSDRTIETEVSEEELRELLGLNSGNIEKSNSITLTNPHRFPAIEVKQQRKVVNKQLSHLISDTRGEVKGRGKQSQFLVYSVGLFNRLIGIVQSENRRYRYNLGKLSDEYSTISIVGSAIDEIPTEKFSKRDLRNRLPAKFTNGHTEKLCLDYFEKMGYIERLRSGFMLENVITYRKINPIKQNKNTDDSDVMLVTKPSESSGLNTQTT
jgi:hypothetical protein